MTWHHPVILVKSYAPNRILKAILYFKGEHFAAFYSLFYKIANIQEIIMALTASIQDKINIMSKNMRVCISAEFPRSTTCICNFKELRIAKQNFLGISEYANNL